ncbi:MAG: acyltransferase [Pseudomonadota bacterium]
MSSQSAVRVQVWDGWRGVAIALVLCGHFFDFESLHEDRMGVDVFFGLSGMLMSIILFENRMSLRDFYIRRLSRIFPALLFLVLVSFAFSAAMSHDIHLAELPASLLFVRTYFPQSPHIWETQTSTAHLWSLNVEEHAYMVMSAMTLLMVSVVRSAVVLLCIGALSIAFATFYYMKAGPGGFEILSINTESASSFIFLSAGYGLIKRRHGWSLPATAFLALIVIAPLCYAYATPLWLRFTLAPIVLAVAVNHLDDLQGLFKLLLSNPVLCWLGTCSYSIYLWQQIFFEWAWALPGGLFTGLVLSVAAGVGSFYLLENPCRRLINARWSAKPVFHPQAATA